MPSSCEFAASEQRQRMTKVWETAADRPVTGRFRIARAQPRRKFCTSRESLMSVVFALLVLTSWMIFIMSVVFALLVLTSWMIFIRICDPDGFGAAFARRPP